jgi:hypothetical protein
LKKKLDSKNKNDDMEVINTLLEGKVAVKDLFPEVEHQYFQTFVLKTECNIFKEHLISQGAIVKEFIQKVMYCKCKL